MRVYLVNKSLQKEDILVITAFELKHVKSITLSKFIISKLEITLKEKGFSI